VSEAAVVCKSGTVQLFEHIDRPKERKKESRNKERRKKKERKKEKQKYINKEGREKRTTDRKT